MDNASALRKLESPTSGEAGLERARALLRRGRIVAAIRYIQQAMPRHPAAAAELMAEAHAKIQVIRQVMRRASCRRIG